MRGADIPQLAPTAPPQGCRHRQLSESGLETAATKLSCRNSPGHHAGSGLALGTKDSFATPLWLQALLFLR